MDNKKTYCPFKTWDSGNRSFEIGPIVVTSPESIVSEIAMVIDPHSKGVYITREQCMKFFDLIDAPISEVSNTIE